MIICIATSDPSEQEKELTASYFERFLLGTFLIYPSASLTLFQTMRCEEFEVPAFEGDDYVMSMLRVDLRLECGQGSRSSDGFQWNSEYDFMWRYAACFTLLYPIGARSPLCGRRN